MLSSRHSNHLSGAGLAALPKKRTRSKRAEVKSARQRFNELRHVAEEEEVCSKGPPTLERTKRLIAAAVYFWELRRGLR